MALSLDPGSSLLENMNIIDVSSLSKSYGPTILLDGVNFALGEADKVGVVGRNGCGKSTLFRILAQLEAADGGNVARRRGLGLGYLPQRPQLDPDMTVRQVLEEHLGEAHDKLGLHARLSEQIADASGEGLDQLMAEQQQVHSWLDHHGAWNLGHRIEQMCDRFSIPDPEARIGTLSGGWNQRVALAGMLLSQPDLLLLDEPTNQLDADTVEWLEEHLRGYPGAVLLITHDRYFLDRVVSRMFELEGGELTSYTGGYSAYLEQKAERLAQEERSQTRLLNLLRREEQWLARGPKARTTKQKARIGRAEELRGQKAGPRRRELSLKMDTDKRLGHTVIESSKLTVELGGKRLIENMDFSLRKGERVGILGPNGCGKTTLIRALLGQLEPTAGVVTLGRNTLVGYLDQQRTGLDEEATVGDSLGDGDWVFVGGPKGQKRHKVGYLEDFLFTRDDQRAPVSTLSGGERARLLLARLMLLGANVLVLDEPTNDLDIPTLQILDEALCDFPGSVLMVTHDRYFLDRVATGLLDFEGGGRVVFYEGNYEIFKRLKSQRVEEEKVEAASAEKVQPKVAATPKARAKKGLTYKEERELETVTASIEELEGRKAGIEAQLADPSALEGGLLELRSLSEEASKVETELETLMERWAELEEKQG